MKKTGASIVLLMILLQGMALFTGCGGESVEGKEELVLYSIENIIVPGEREGDLIVEWRRKSTGPGDVDPEELAQRFWEYKGGALIEISREEHKELAAMRDEGDNNVWTYSQHAVTVLEMDESGEDAVVEIGTLYNSLSGKGVKYRMRSENGTWEVLSEQQVW
ncbi:MAG: hypothetical protein SWK76_09770 [Actinomycetota bacterium]|nr:hypothetical protein [Actinomycetota bacterium]